MSVRVDLIYFSVLRRLFKKSPPRHIKMDLYIMYRVETLLDAMTRGRDYASGWDATLMLDSLNPIHTMHKASK
jgi:hypothetical protein